MYLVLSGVKQLDNVHLIAFNPQSVMVSTKLLQEIYHLGMFTVQIYPSILHHLYRVLHRTLTAVLSDNPHPKLPHLG